MKYLKTLAVATLGMFAITACDNEKEAEIKVGDTEISMEMEKEMNSFETRMSNLGEKIDAQLAAIDAKMEDAGEDMKEELAEERAEWREMRENLDDRMKRFNNNAKANWAEFKADTENFFSKVERDLED